jgi:hypothetical protein
MTIESLTITVTQWVAACATCVTSKVNFDSSSPDVRLSKKLAGRATRLRNIRARRSIITRCATDDRPTVAT